MSTVVDRNNGGAAPPYLQLSHLQKDYGPVMAVDAINLDVRKGELIGFLGPSGCGKSTTLRMIGGLIPQSAGEVVLNGRTISRLPAHKRNIGLVFQNYALFPHMTVKANVEFGLKMRGWERSKIAERAQQMLASVHLDQYGGRRPRELSGGQQQRVALARALAIEPDLLLLDEPLSNLDAKLRIAMRKEIRDIQRNYGITTVFVTHDQDEALAICDRLVIMRAGRIEQVGTASEVYDRPASAFVADFVGRTIRVDAALDANGVVHAGDRALAVDREGQPGPCLALVRPHHIHLWGRDHIRPAVTDHAFDGRINSVSYLGDVIHYDVESDLGMVQIEVTSHGSGTIFGEGDPVSFGWRNEALMLFPRERESV
ncbi:ABC transporter ATP-binding protein [Rhizobium leguminosarum]|uniref:ABC transporter ATP-binding protein n=1 Tax=Rhizobium leguminosarum TaxID=384 RepID=UPI00144147DC|nr:ABC transporter ATP-binding protein [Rhizobium leguminosarum]NKL53432.1 ATP-binding cassette domain-containing protein [Rhizobium leguminosarum bv. viciae]